MDKHETRSLPLIAAFIAVPLVEIYLIIQVGQVIGPWWTIVLLIAVSVLGSWLVRREGRRAWRALTTALSTGRLPDREVLDAGLVLVGGALMLTPGFVTDAVGFFVMMPATRPLARRVLAWVVGRQLTRMSSSAAGAGFGVGGMTGTPPRDRVVPGEAADRGDPRGALRATDVRSASPDGAGRRGS